MRIEYAETNKGKAPSTGKRSNMEIVREWKKTKTDLIKRAGDLKKRAETLKKNNPAMSAELMKRAQGLTAEAAAMSKPKKGEKGISTQQIRRASVIGWLALYKEKEG